MGRRPAKEEMKMHAAFGKPGTCKYCGKRILWKKTASGKYVPCDVKAVCYHIPAGESGSKTIVTGDGRIISADEVLSVVADGVGHVLHTTTCERGRQ